MAGAAALGSTYRVGWIGLGSMGLAMALNLQKHLEEIQAPLLRYTNRTMSRGQPLQDRGAKPCESITNLTSEADIIFISLSGDDAVQAAITQILSSNTLSSKIIVDTSTISPATTASITSQISSADASFIAAPVFGATPVAVQGKLLMALAGPPSAISTIRPYVESCLARSVLVVGESPAQATLLKTTGNFITAALAETIAEAHVLAEKGDISIQIVDELIRQNYGAYAHGISQKLMTGVYAPSRGERPRSDLNLAIKDVGHGICVAKEVGTRLKIADMTMEHLIEASKFAERTNRSLDSSAVYGVVRMEAGLDFDNTIVKERHAE